MAGPDPAALHAWVKAMAAGAKPPSASDSPGSVSEGASSQSGEHGAYGGKGPYHLPVDHRAAMVVPDGGASCANCSFLGQDKLTCESPHYAAWAGGSKALPAPPEKFCSDWWEPGDRGGA